MRLSVIAWLVHECSGVPDADIRRVGRLFISLGKRQPIEFKEQLLRIGSSVCISMKSENVQAGQIPMGQTPSLLLWDLCCCLSFLSTLRQICLSGSWLTRCEPLLNGIA